MTKEEYLSVLQRISDASESVDSAYEKIDNASSTLCDVNQVMSYNPSMEVIRNRGGEVIGYNYKYVSPDPPNTTGMGLDSNIDSGLYGSGGGGQTRGGGAGRASNYAGGIDSDSVKGTGLVSGIISKAWAAVSAAGKFGKHVLDTASDTMARIGDALADGFEDILVPGVEGTADSIRALFGADPEHGEVSMYLDEDTIGALGIVLRDGQVFERGPLEVNVDYTQSSDYLYCNWHMPATFGYIIEASTYSNESDGNNKKVYTADNGAVGCVNWYSETTGEIAFVGRVPFTVTRQHVYYGSIIETQYISSTPLTSKHGEVGYYYWPGAARILYAEGGTWIIGSNGTGINRFQDLFTLAFVDIPGSTRESESMVPGVSDESGATIPVDAITGADPHVVAQQLEQQYPDVMGSPIQVTVMDDSCNQKTINYYQVPISYSPTNITIGSPVTGTTQIAPSFNPDISLPDIDMSKMIEQIVLQLIGSGTGDTTETIPSDDPGEEPVIQVLEDDPPHTGIGDTPVEELPQVDVRSMWHVYNPSVSELATLGNWLWSTNVLDILIRTFANPLESVMGVHALYAEPSVSSSQSIVVGPLTSTVSSRVVSSQYAEVDCGSVWVTEYFGNVFDYAPYTSISLFLPFVGIVPLDISEVMRAEISIRYNVDCYTGACIAMVSVIRDGVGGVLYQFPGNCAVEYPVSGASYSRMLQSMIGAATSALSAGIASAGNPVMGAVAAGSSFMSGGEKIKVSHSGSFASNVGAMGSKIPYLIISRPQINTPDGFEFFSGFSSNYISQLSACHGFTKCKEVHLNCPGAYKSELDEIESLLLSGVIFPD